MSAAARGAFRGGTSWCSSRAPTRPRWRAQCAACRAHEAGVIGGSTYGVAKSVTLVPVRVLDCNGGGSLSSLLAGLDWILQDHAQAPRPAVVNMSLGGDASSALDAEVNLLIAAGMTPV